MSLFLIRHQTSQTNINELNQPILYNCKINILRIPHIWQICQISQFKYFGNSLVFVLNRSDHYYKLIIQMDSSFEQDSIPSLQASFNEDIDDDEDDMAFFQNQQKPDWRELLKKDQNQNQQNQFHMNSKDQLFNDASKNIKNKSKKEKRVSQQAEALKAYHYLIKMWTFKQILKCARRAYNTSLHKRQNTAKLLTMIGMENVLKLVQARGKRVEEILPLIENILIQSNFKSMPNLLQRTIYLLNFCNVQARILTLVDFHNFNLFDKYKIRNQGSNKNNRRKKATKIREYVRWIDEQSQKSESQESNQFDDLEKYNFMSKKYINHFVEKGREVKKQTQFNFRFRNSNSNFFLKPFEWIQVYNEKTKSWKILSLSSFSFITDQDLKKCVQGVATVFIYSCKILNIKPQYTHLFQKRPFKNIEIMDQTIRFCDGLVKIKKRKGALDLKSILKKIVNFGQYQGPQALLSSIQKSSRKSSYKTIQRIVTNNYFPSTLYEFSTSQYFVIPSQLSKFDYLPKEVEPIEDLQFEGQKVYSRLNVIHLHSKNGWVDVGRMVKIDEYGHPRKQTLTKQNKDLKLYSFDQTIPFKWQLVDGKFQKNQYDDVYINQYTQPPTGCCIIPQNVSWVCKKNGFQFTKVIQGFKDGKPNFIGHAIFIKDKQPILKLYEERVKQLQQKREKNKRKNLIGIWKKLFKCIIVTDQLKKKYQPVVKVG